MRSTVSFAIALTSASALLAHSLPAFSAEMAAAPIEKIRAVYGMLDAAGEGNAGDPNNPYLRSVLSPGFLALWRENTRCWDDSEGEQMWVAGQDIKLTGLSIAPTKQSADEVVVEARFKNFDDQQSWQYVFHRHEGAWLVDEVLESGQSVSQNMSKGCRK